jgi:Fe-S oxidoreductase
VHDALDLCLSCKGCKRDCPMQVDVATYKAEFTYRWYRWRLRPRIAYTFGFMPWIARVLAVAPRLVNALTHTKIVRRLLGVHPDRPIPVFADRSFRALVRTRSPANPDGEPVLLWADTWTDRFHPNVGLAAVEVLEALGFRVSVLPQPICCGRPLYDYGMLGPARRALRRCLAATREGVDRGARVVVLEPSCASVFRDELPNLLPGDLEATRLSSSVVTLAELVATRRPDVALSLERTVLFHAHCHHKAVLGSRTDAELLRRAGAEVEALDVGCCGMSGIFGYEQRKYDVSRTIGENGVLPAMRNAAPDTILCADGFSCRTQIADFTGRRPLHLAEILRDVLRAGASSRTS